MSATPSDEWLLALLDEKLPEELTPAEFAALHERAAASPSVRRAILERVRFEEALHGVLGNPAVSVDQIVRRARSGRRTRLIGTGLAALFLIAAGGVWWLAGRADDEGNVDHEEVIAAHAVTEEKPEQPPSIVTDQPQLIPVEAPRPSTASNAPLVATPPAEAALNADAQQEQARWEPLLGESAPVVTFSESATSPFGSTVPGYEVVDEFLPSSLDELVAAVPGQPFEITSGQWRGQQFAGLEGMARLRPRWRPDSVLRLAAFDIDALALHFWNGPQGVTLRYYPHQRPQLLAAYETSRDTDGPEPTITRLLQSDGGRFARSNAGAIELRHQAGRLVVTRGTTPLLVVPLASPPTEVLLEGRMRLRSLSMHRGEQVALPTVDAGANLLPAGPIDTLDWLTSAEPAPRLDKKGGRVTLTSPAEAMPGRQIVWAALPIPDSTPTGLCEAVFRIESLTPGCGLFLGDATGQPVQTLFASESDRFDSPLMAFGWTSRNGSVPEPRWRWDVDPENELAPAVGAGSWVKVVVGPGGLKILVSGDGEHWGPAARSPERSIRGAFASVGIFAMADGKPRSITLSAVDVRALSGLASASSDELRLRVPEWNETAPARPADWLTWVMATQPEDVSHEDWLRACGVETLARGSASDDVASAVIDGLIRDAIDSDRPVASVLALLHDAAILSDVGRSAEFVAFYEELAGRILERGGPPAEIAGDLAAVVDGYLSAPLWSESRLPAVPAGVVRNAAAFAVWHSEGAAAATRIAAALTPAHPESGWTTGDESALARLVSWSAAVARDGPQRIDGAVRLGWQHPLATEPGREEMTLAAELEAALEAGAYDDAAGLLPALTRLPGLLPALGDPGRSVPAAGLVAEAARRSPELVATLNERLGPAGSLRVREAAAAGDDDAMRAAAVRFYGTPVAAEARRWLGETALARGHFVEALGHFTAAIESAASEEHQALTARLRLAAALAGQEAGQPVSEAVALGTQTFDADAFEKMIDELRRSRSTESEEQDRRIAISGPSAVAPQARGRFDGDVGRNPGRGEFQRFDWAGRQIGITIDRGVFYFTNRFQVVAFDPERKTPWWTIGLGNEQGEAHAFPNVAFVPVVRQDRLFVRRLTSRNPELACLAVSAGGKVLWRSWDELTIASDPFFDGDRLLAITTSGSIRGGGLATLSLTRFRDDDGSVIASAPLLILNSADGQRPSASVTPTGDGFILQTSGTLARCGRSGGIAWVRRLPHLPANVDLDRDRVPPGPPVLVGDRLYAALPGSRAVVCLDAVTGELVWSRALGELERLHGPAGPVILVRSGEALLGLAAESGEVRWRFSRSGLLDGLVSDDQTILTTARTELQDKLDGLSLLRIDPATGTLRSEQVVRVQRSDGVRCGPLFVHNGTVWGFVGESWREATRTLVEFAADPSLPAVEAASQPGPLAHWRTHVEPQTDLNTAAVLPGWTAIGSQSPRRSKEGARFRDEQRGESWVLETESGRDRAARFVKTVSLADDAPKLIARVGRDDDAGWTLRLLVDGEPFAAEPINKESAPDGWRTVTIDLAPLAGRTILLTVDQAPPGEGRDKATRAYWKSLRIE